MKKQSGTPGLGRALFGAALGAAVMSAGDIEGGRRLGTDLSADALARGQAVPSVYDGGKYTKVS
jgi:hypothetical protein